MHKTIIGDVKAGRTPEELRVLSKVEGLSIEKLRDRVASGQVVVIRNVERPSERLVAIGKGLTTKINVNLGTSTEVVDLDAEMKKVEIANKWADTVMDLSVGGNLDEIRRMVLARSKIPVGTVPVYQAFIESFSKRGGSRGTAPYTASPATCATHARRQGQTPRL
ncbi:MAG: phosphomethylpyrimidine synthase ThiC, partial [Pyrobaculum sp.]